ncbi:hypothetical protein FPF71_01170 [Algibacter amylolyticus]|uniref:TonB-dependent receptor plug domain-containing protein n=1 Tax=Algibacter amylolyticus TaxID=1608400 RepID=A0A5M7BIH5_9FLAO|nr:TonB-dependent receptor plug domain-containing protein [Algibacter amylolyticus]KAA5827484.1 TonB-dependent receptor plug domain-containing protein [Algibacter amylolyticus]MBB5266681.1 hypothetical protein [Algibacter amylolyticus]TSJ81729.1 hypothetical protein FPF71_01170 [Algibacter amylolyticus]
MLNQPPKITSTIVRCVFLLILSFNFSFSQQTPTSTPPKEGIPDIEKVYLHTDRSNYVVGEDLWYKAYLVYAFNNLLFDHSNVLYVELIAANSKIIARNKTRLDDGLGYGDFKLTDSLGVKPGKYQIRAYTNWMRNFDDDFVFTKEIEVFDVFDKSNKNAKNTALQNTEPSNIAAATKSDINLQFFPEGGSLIEDVLSVVAFKAVDSYGNPVKVKGEVFDDNGNLVTLLGSLHDGMGKFIITPKKGERYYAKITNSNGEEILEVKLPKAKDQGYLLSAVSVRGKNMISIKTNAVTIANYQSAPVKIVCSSRGISYFEGSQPLSQTSITFELPKTNLLEGVLQITLYDALARPQSERLIYIEKKKDVNVTLKTVKEVYKPNEKVTLYISSKTAEDKAVPASFSLSSVDVNGMQGSKDFGTNICSYFLLESDIRGKVHNPSFYFDKANPRRLAYLDVLLLTQGWRDFLWKEMPKINPYNEPYVAEKGITISGTVKQIEADIPKPNNTVLLNMFNKGKMRSLTGLTDANGRFKFENLVFMGPTTMMLNTQDDKRKERGMFELDSLLLPPLASNFTADSTVFSSKSLTIKNNIYRKNITFGITGETVLDAVEINGKGKSNVPKSLYGTPDHSYIIDEDTPHFSSIYLLLQFKIPGIQVSGTSIKFFGNSGTAQIRIDGVPFEGDIGFIYPDDVAKVESMNGPSASVFGLDGANGVILIYLKEGALNKRSKTKLKPHSITKQIDGLYDARVFYSPKPEELAFKMDNSDAIRNTLYWNAFVHPDETGNTQVSYYNTNVETDVKVTLEGLTSTGIPIVVKTHYAIKK